MAESSRNSVPPANVRYPMGETQPEGSTPQTRPELHELPETASPANNPALNRSAELLGRSVGTAVAGVRSLPLQIDRLRSRIHLVGGREALESRLSGIRDSAAEAVAEWRGSAEERLNELGQEAGAYAYHMTDRANHGLEDFSRELQRRVWFRRRTIRQRMAEFQHLQSEHPLKVIAAYAATGFVAGVSLRVWRSNRV